MNCSETFINEMFLFLMIFNQFRWICFSCCMWLFIHLGSVWNINSGRDYGPGNIQYTKMITLFFNFKTSTVYSVTCSIYFKVFWSN